MAKIQKARNDCLNQCKNQECLPYTFKWPYFDSQSRRQAFVSPHQPDGQLVMASLQECKYFLLLPLHASCGPGCSTGGDFSTPKKEKSFPNQSKEFQDPKYPVRNKTKCCQTEKINDIYQHCNALVSYCLMTNLKIWKWFLD